MRWFSPVWMLALAATPVVAQLGLPLPGGGLRQVGDIARGTLGRVGTLAATASDLAGERISRLSRFVAVHSADVEFDDARQPARRGEVLLLDPDAELLRRAAAGGFAVGEVATIEEFGIGYARLLVPRGRSLAQAVRDLRRLVPGKEVSADQIHFPSGAVSPARRASGAPVAQVTGGTVGVIDGGVAPGPLLIAQAGFAAGAPQASPHAAAIVSLLAAAGTRQTYAADVYGNDAAGGSALAIARALGWMSMRRVPVVSISLVGPANPLLRRAVAIAQAKGMIIAAAVGNDGAAAPPAYPASYPGVIAVTGVDRRGRVLIEAGRALHLDYAAPGTDISIPAEGGRRTNLRGTSFAAPLAAARIAANRTRAADRADVIRATDAEAVRGGGRIGRGILCGGCRSGK